MYDEAEDYEETRKQALKEAEMISKKHMKMEQRRQRIKELEKNIFEMIESSEADKLNIKPTVVEPKIPELTKEELTESISRSLVPDNPYCDIKRVIYDYKEGIYRRVAVHSKEVLLYELQGSLVPNYSAEADEQRIRQEVEEEWKERIALRNEGTKMMIEEKALAIREARRKELAGDEGVEEEGEEEEEEEEEAAKVEEAVKQEDERGSLAAKLASIKLPSLIKPKEDTMRSQMLAQKKFMNRFTYSDRSVLTYHTLSRDKQTQTYPTPKIAINGQVTQWLISESYDKDYSAIMEAKEKERLAKMTLKPVKEDKTAKKPLPQEDPIYKRMAEGVLILERMLNQNIYDNIAQDCAFYEDPADKYRNDEGVLLPLWEFRYGAAKNVAVTEVKWNPAYKDLFGATFGIMDFNEPNNAGYVCIFTLKNPSFPEFVKHLEAGATCLDFHRSKSFYICVGMSNGSVVAFNTQLPNCDTQYRSGIEGNKSLISSVIWSDDPRDKNLAFFSSGTDGRICKWILMQNELQQAIIVELFVDRHDLSPRCQDVRAHVVASTLAFHPTDPETFMVGTDLGSLYKCSVSYASTYLYQMKAHELPVKRISYNPYVPDILATCGGDWRVKVWEDGRTEPLFLYSLDNPVGDVQWAPYSSTVLAAVTAAGRVFVYDLQFDKYEPACAQYVVCSDDNIATRMRFNPFGLKMPLIIIGDSSGCITTVKISPNLRVKPKPPKKTEFAVVLDDFTYEVRKLEKILSFVKEPIVLELPKGEEIKNLVE